MKCIQIDVDRAILVPQNCNRDIKFYGFLWLLHGSMGHVGSKVWDLEYVLHIEYSGSLCRGGPGHKAVGPRVTGNVPGRFGTGGSCYFSRFTVRIHS